MGCEESSTSRAAGGSRERRRSLCGAELENLLGKPIAGRSGASRKPIRNDSIQPSACKNFTHIASTLHGMAALSFKE
eukprot:5657550-Pyramimonas_sp.AAC.1